MSAYFSEYLIVAKKCTQKWLHNHKKEKPEFHVQDRRSWGSRGEPWRAVARGTPRFWQIR